MGEELRLLRGGEGYLPVLAVPAVEVAAPGAEGEAGRSGEEVEERLLLDGVVVDGGDARVVVEDDATVAGAAHAADAEAAVGDEAAPVADVAAYLAAGLGLVEDGLALCDWCRRA